METLASEAPSSIRPDVSTLCHRFQPIPMSMSTHVVTDINAFRSRCRHFLQTMSTHFSMYLKQPCGLRGGYLRAACLRSSVLSLACTSLSDHAANMSVSSSRMGQRPA